MYLRFVVGWWAQILLEKQSAASMRAVTESKVGCRALPCECLSGWCRGWLGESSWEPGEERLACWSPIFWSFMGIQAG